MRIPFNKAYIVGKELHYISQSVLNGEIKGDGPFTKKCCQWLTEHSQAQKTLLTNSCTAALEMSALLCDIREGDEVIMPSYTFTSTANAFVLRGATPVFCDIRQDTLNIDETLIEELITPKTKAICVVHYAGVSCEMDPILKLAQHHNIAVIEDAAQGIQASYKGKPLGSMGDLGCYSFHETKNFSSGEGGALLINQDKYKERAEYLHEKGTNRSRFFRGEVDKYTWVDSGSSFLPSEIIAAFLYAQLEQATTIQNKRMAIWNRYDASLRPIETTYGFSTPTIPNNCEHNAHMYYLIAKSEQQRNDLIQYLREQSVYAPFHFQPLHSSPYGKKFHQSGKELPFTDSLSSRLIRLPLYYDINHEEQDFVIEETIKFFKSES